MGFDRPPRNEDERSDEAVEGVGWCHRISMGRLNN